MNRPPKNCGNCNHRKDHLCTRHERWIQCLYDLCNTYEVSFLVARAIQSPENNSATAAKF